MVNALQARPGELKIVFAGSMGAGKTTAIRALVEGGVVSTEVPLSEGAHGDKQATTVGFDYGECRIDDSTVLRLFGTPGQARFRFMWDILAQGAFGLVVLADNSREDPVGDVLQYLQAFAGHIPVERMVVGIGRTDSHPEPGAEHYCERLRAAGFDVPTLDVDVRRSGDVRLLLAVLVSLAEASHA